MSSYRTSSDKAESWDSEDSLDDSQSRLMQSDFNDSQSRLIPTEEFSKYYRRKRTVWRLLLWVIALVTLFFGVVGVFQKSSLLAKPSKSDLKLSSSSSVAGLVSSWKLNETANEKVSNPFHSSKTNATSILSPLVDESSPKSANKHADEEVSGTPSSHQANATLITSISKAVSTPTSVAKPVPMPTSETKEVAYDSDGTEELPCPKGIYDDVLVVLKTGAAVVYDRALIHLHTTLRCIPHKLYIADVDMKVGKYHFVDVIQDLDPKLLAHSDLEYYHLQRKMQSRHEDLIEFSQKAGTKLWDLDKFKFIPMMARAWKQRLPQTNWFVFLEADSMADFANLKLMLDQKNPNEPWFFGAPMFINNIAFAHGGSGFVLSREAMQRSVGKSPEQWIESYSDKALGECCGDFVLTNALRDEGVNLTSAYPLIQGDNVNLAPMLPDFWCRPVVTMHHVKSREVGAYWSLAEQTMKQVFEGKRAHSLLWKDVFKTFVEPSLQRYKLDWDNISLDWEFSKEKHGESGNDEEKKAFRSPAGCEEKCQRESECRQWNHRPDVCKMGKAVRVGQAPPKDQENFISGWMMERIDSYRMENEECENGANFNFQ